MPSAGPNTKALTESFFAGGVGMKQQLFLMLLLLYCCVLLRLFAHINNNIAINGIVLLLIRVEGDNVSSDTHTYKHKRTHNLYVATMLVC